MPKLFARNLDRRGRLVRAVMGLILAVAAVVAGLKIWWVGLVLGAAAVFTLFEAARGWCALRACGIKTKV